PEILGHPEPCRTGRTPVMAPERVTLGSHRVTLPLRLLGGTAMAAGPGDELEAAGRGHLRAPPADPGRGIGTLKAGFVQGGLHKDEFDLGVGRTLASRTYGALAALTADLPTRLTAAASAEPDRESANTKKKAVVALACATPAIPGLLFALPP